MFSDTHFHFHLMTDGDEVKGSESLRGLAKENPFFMMDIGTRCDDLEERILHFEKSLSHLTADEKKRVESFFYFSAGIWPDIEEIKDRERCVKLLENQIVSYKKNKGESHHFAAIGECGLDHHWNPSNPDGRNEADFDSDIYKGEHELFVMQLNLARKMNLPVVVHSRDAFENTISCIDEAGWHNGIIHCWSYGIDEARAFVDRGWYIALGGATTYTKKSRMEQMHKVINFIPADRLLLETDAPYLAPVPMRGHPNTPLYINHTYEFIASQRNMTVQELSDLVDSNCRRLFHLD